MLQTLEQKYYESEIMWADGMLEDSANYKRIKLSVSMVPEYVKSIVDVGCGNGVFVHALQRKNPNLQILGIERSQAALKFVNTEKLQGDITNIPLPDKSFDCACCLQVLEHIPFNEYPTALSELARVSKKYILISVPFKEKLENNVSQCPHCKTTFNNDLHMRSYQEPDIDHLFDAQGYECIRKEVPLSHYEYAGITWLKSMKSILKRRKQPSIFLSPICPVCGYENHSFQPINDRGSFDEVEKLEDALQPEVLRKKSFKERLKSIWPKKEIPGYWIVALYARAN
ncbi:MAG TPA: class I SAM-dependent methyltransferase [Chitinophagaceae bacterium]|nr:class I SAM-dependent methyltransferase [Chitinophagaceae bacterium]